MSTIDAQTWITSVEHNIVKASKSILVHKSGSFWWNIIVVEAAKSIIDAQNGSLQWNIMF